MSGLREYLAGMNDGPGGGLRGSRKYNRQDCLPVGPFREAFLKSDLTSTEIAGRLGWYTWANCRGHRKYVRDGRRVLRTLGISKYHTTSGRYGRYVHRQGITHETAINLCEVMELYPVDMGL